MSGNPLGSLLGVPDKVESILNDQFFYSSLGISAPQRFRSRTLNSTVTAKKTNTAEQRWSGLIGQVFVFCSL